MAGTKANETIRNAMSESIMLLTGPAANTASCCFLGFFDINANKEDSSVKYPAELTGMKSGEIITSIDGEGVVYTVNFTKVMDAKKPGEVVQIVTDGGIYYATLQPHPKNASKGYLGISGEQSYHVDTTLPVLYQKSFPGFIWLSELFM